MKEHLRKSDGDSPKFLKIERGHTWLRVEVLKNIHDFHRLVP